MARSHRTFKSGDRLRDVSASDWQAISNAARAVDGLTVRAPLRLHRDKQGVVLTIDMPSTQKRPAGAAAEVTLDRTVVLKVNPADSAPQLIVQTIAYAASPPVAGVYAWVGDEFIAYPDFGYEASDYADFVYESAEVPNLTDRPAKYLTARKRGEEWLVARPPDVASSGRKFAVVTVATSGAATITVQPVKLSSAVPPAWVSDGGPTQVPCWPGLTGTDFKTHESSIGMATSVYIALCQIGGTWYAEQTMPWYTLIPSAALQRGDCEIR